MAKKNPLALTAAQADRVAKEKERASLAMGDSPAKAKKYADEVRAYAAKRRGGN